MKLVTTVLLIFLSSIAQSQAKSQAQQSESSGYQQSMYNQDQYSQAELAQMLAPIALYPDTLLTHILIATTYPLELVKAQQWLDNHKGLSPERLTHKLQYEMDNKNWDASVKALMPFPRVLQRLTDDLDWTQDLGDAFLDNEESVLASIQHLRKQAEQAGNLSKMSNNRVSYEGNNIVIEPQQTQVVYVPYYDARVVYGTWHWRNYPPIYWTSPRHYVRHYYAADYQPFYWHSAVHIRHNFFFGAFHWHKRHIVINHYNKRHYKRSQYGSFNHNNRRKIVTSSGGKRWKHKPQHRRGVSYGNKRLNKQYKANQHNSKWAGRKSKSNKHNAIVTQKKERRYVNNNRIKSNDRPRNNIIGSHEKNRGKTSHVKNREHNTANIRSARVKETKQAKHRQQEPNRRVKTYGEKQREQYKVTKPSRVVKQNNKPKKARSAKQEKYKRNNRETKVSNLASNRNHRYKKEGRRVERER